MEQVMGDLHLKSLATYAGNHQMAADHSPSAVGAIDYVRGSGN